MARNKKPSIYSDRANIGSAEELDEYGVWVKGEPQILSADEKTGLTSDLDDFALPAADDSSGDESLSIDDAVFDAGDASGPSQSEKIEFPNDDIELDINDNPLTSQTDLADLNMPSDDSLDIPAGNENIDIEDASFDEFEVPAVSGGDETVEAASSVPEENDSTAEEFAGVSADSENLNVDDFDGNLTNSETADSAITANDEFDTEELNLPTVKSIENNITSVQDDFDLAQSGDGGLSTLLLKKIASELSSIRSELTDLKREFASIRSLPQEEEKHTEGGGFFSDDDDEAISLTGDELNNILSTGGTTEEGVPETIDDEEDEAIALTGDELDNILNSADFTEESGTEETPESEFAVDDTPVSEGTSDDANSELEDIDIDIDITPDTSNGIADMNLTADALPDLGDMAIDDAALTADALPDLSEIGAATEDTSLAADDFALSESDTTTEETSFTADDLPNLPEDGITIEDTSLTTEDLPDLSESGASIEDTPLSMDDLPDLSAEDAIIDETSLTADDLPDAGDATIDESLVMDDLPDLAESDTTIDEPLVMDDLPDLSDSSAATEDTSLAIDDLPDLADSGASAEDTSLAIDDLPDLPDSGASAEDTSLAIDDLHDLAEDGASAEDTSLAIDDLPDLSEGDTTIDEPLVMDDLPDLSEGDTTIDEPLVMDDLPDLSEVDTGIKTTLNADNFPDLSEDGASAEDTSLSADDLTNISEVETLTIDEEPAKNDGLDVLREEGAPIPITDTPENSSYLEESADIDLSDAVIDEPELSAEGISDELTEPTLEGDDFNLDSFDDLSIDSELDLDSEISSSDDTKSALDKEAAEPAQEIHEDAVLDTESLDEAVDNVISESNFEEELEEPVVFDDFQDFSADNFDSVIEPEPPAKPAPVKQPAAQKPAAPPPVQQAVAAPQAAPQPAPIIVQAPAQPAAKELAIPSGLRSELRNILSYMDQLLESLPEEKIEEFAKSEYFDSYKKLFKDLGLV
jgi:pilus assembly protein FimV